MNGAMNQPLREVRLYGALGERFGRVHRLAVGSPREAAHALGILLPGFGEQMLAHEAGYHVFVGRGRGCDRTEATLAAPAGAAEPICIVPVVAGRKSGLFGIVAGIALLVIAPYAAGALFSAGTAFGTSAAIAIGNYSGSIAAALILGGIVQMVSPQPERASGQAERNVGYAFDGPVNDSQQGVAVPLTVGRMITGGVIVSAGISTEEFVSATASSTYTAQTLPPWMPADPLADGPGWDSAG